MAGYGVRGLCGWVWGMWVVWLSMGTWVVWLGMGLIVWLGMGLIVQLGIGTWVNCVAGYGVCGLYSLSYFFHL